MITRKDLTIVFLAALCVTLTLSSVARTGSSTDPYDPWIDTNDDGRIDMRDIAALCALFGTLGTPINKTAMLLDLQDRVNALEEQQDYVKTTRFYTQNETFTSETSWEDAAVFVWSPNDVTNNAIMSGNCYFQFLNHVYFRVLVNEHELIGTNFGESQQYQWSPVYPFVVYPYAEPNQSNYTIRFQVHGSEIQVKDINILLNVMDGLPPS
jgi:hypothetical protein